MKKQEFSTNLINLIMIIKKNLINQFYKYIFATVFIFILIFLNYSTVYAQDADFSQTSDFVRELVAQNLAHPMPQGVVLNVNFPINKGEALKGLKVCRQAKAKWDEEFDERISPYGKTYYWLTGQFVNQDPGEDTDEYALANGYVSVVPVQFDLTAYQHLAHFEQLLSK